MQLHIISARTGIHLGAYWKRRTTGPLQHPLEENLCFHKATQKPVESSTGSDQAADDPLWTQAVPAGVTGAASVPGWL